MARIGFVLNPVAGMGGRVGLKGTDDVASRAVELGAQPIAPARALDTLRELKRRLLEETAPLALDWVTCSDDMGADTLAAAGFANRRIVAEGRAPFCATDTKDATRRFLEAGVDLILFCGGDGTARDIASIAGIRVPLLGIPSGVKMYSGVFGVTPARTAEILIGFLKGELALDSEEVLRAIHMTDDEVPIDIVLHTPGGLVLATLQIARAICHRKGKVSVFVPHYAMSGSTLIALAADEIVMCPHSVLGPIDPQVDKYPAVSLIKVVEQKPIAEIDDETLIMADVARKALTQVRDAACELLGEHMAPEQAAAIAEKLSNGTWTHDYPIPAAQAKALGLPVTTEMPEAFLELMTLYFQPVRVGRGGVEYLPVPHRKEAASS